MENKYFNLTQTPLAVVHLGIIVAVSYFSRLHSYLLFHSLIEIVSIVIGFSIFIIIWNSRRFSENNFYHLMGVTFLFASLIALIHTFSYKGMGILQNQSANIPTQLWLASQYLVSASFAVAPFFNKKKFNSNYFLLGYSLITTLLLLSIFYWQIFPTAYIEGSGLTTFKKVSEYVITAGFIFALVMVLKIKKDYDNRFLTLLCLGIGNSIFSELSFTLYVGVYDYFNMLGHLLKAAAFYFFYLAMVETSLLRPYKLLFKNLKDSQLALKVSEEKYRHAVTELHKFQVAAKSASEMIMILDPKGNVIFSNKSAEKITGYKVGDQMNDLEEKNITSPATEMIVPNKNKDQLVKLNFNPIVNHNEEIVFIVSTGNTKA